jgi:hypothetical protein
MAWPYKKNYKVKKLLIMETNAQIKMCAQTIVQFVFHEGDSVKCPLIFN